MSSAIVKQQTGALKRLELTDEQRLVIKQQIAPPTAKTEEVAYFMSWCEKTGLDPFLKQSYLIERKVKLPNGSYESKHEPMAAEAGIGAVAEGHPEYLGIECDNVYEGDLFTISKPHGTAEASVTHTWDLQARVKAGWRLVGAWAHVRRKGIVTPPVFLRTETRIQTFYDKQTSKHVPTSFWAKDPAGQILKCARAMAYRLAFRDVFGAAYVREEMGTLDTSEGPEPIEGTATSTKTAALIDRLPSVEGEVVNSKPVEAKPVEVRTFSKPADPAAPGLVKWGKLKGQPVAGLSDADLIDTIAMGEQRIIGGTGTEPWRQSVLDGLAELDNESNARHDRERALASDKNMAAETTDRIPGEEG